MYEEDNDIFIALNEIISWEQKPKYQKAASIN